MSIEVSPALDHSRKQHVSTERIRVGFVMHEMQVAGAEMLVKRLIEDLESEIEPVIFCLDAIGTIGEQMAAQGIEVICLDRRPGIDWSVASRLRALVKKYRIQILHAHQYSPFFYSAVSRLFGRHQARIVFTEHGRHFPDVVSARRRLVNRFVLQRYADAANACCDFSARAVERIDGFSSVSTTRNGIAIEEFRPVESKEEKAELRQRLGIGEDEFCVVSVARFHPIKDHGTLLRAWRIVAGQVGDARLLLVGDGPDRSKMEALASELEIADSVTFLGIRNDIREIMQAADVFAMASLSEASSLTLLEAMACGCPAVVTDVGGNSEHIRDGVEGRLAPRRDSTALAAAILELRDSDVAQQMSLASRKRIEDEFDVIDTVSSYRSLYQDVMARARASR